jgi:Ca2+-binding RTX toxin-like protein
VCAAKLIKDETMPKFTFHGTSADEIIKVSANGQDVVLTSDTGSVLGDVSGVDNVMIHGISGDDTIDASALPAGLTQLTIDGGSGNDTIIGSQGADLLFGGSGDDVVIGGRGNDAAQLGSGDDLFIWNPGEGSDVVDGDSGFDTLDFRGANISENVTISANGSHARFFRDVANVTMDLDNVERIQFEALGGADKIVVNDLTGTDVTQVDINLAGMLNGSAGDGAADTVTVNGTDGNDHINVRASGTQVTVSGLPAQVTIDHAEGGDLGDHLVIKGGAGDDTINASALPAGTIGLTLDGGAGNDTFVFTFGTNGHDVVQGFQAHGAGAQGDVIALASATDHTFAQAVADGHIAQSGADVVISDGANVVATLQNIALASLHANDFLFS